MGRKCITSALIVPVSLSPGLLDGLVPVNYFDDTLVTRGSGLVIQIDYEAEAGQCLGQGSNRYRFGYFAAGRGKDPVRDKAARAKRPQQFVDQSRLLAVPRSDMDPVVCSVGLFGQPAGEVVAARRVTGIQQVKVNAGHGTVVSVAGHGPVRDSDEAGTGSLHSVSYLLSRNWISSGTGRPVAPLFLPETHAVPAISR